MVIRASQLLHWMIKRLGDDQQVEPITDLVISKINGRLEAIQFDKGYLALNDDITIHGGYVLVTKGLLDFIQEHPFLAEDHHLHISEIMSKEIYDQNHHLMGIVGDCIFNLEHRRLIAIENSQGLFSDLLAGRRKIDCQSITSLDGYKIVMF